MTTALILQITGLFLAILIAIFRNQLALIGDKLIANRKIIWKSFVSVIKIIVYYLSPIFWIIYDSLYMDFDKYFVLSFCLNSFILVFRFSFDMYLSLNKEILIHNKVLLLTYEQILKVHEELGNRIYVGQKEVLELIKTLNESYGLVNNEVVEYIKTLDESHGLVNKEIVNTLERLSEDIEKIAPKYKKKQG